MNPEENTQIKIIPPNGKGEEITIIINQEMIDNQRLDVLRKACQRAWQDFIITNDWE